MRLNPDDWDSLSRERPDHLVDRKRLAESTTDAHAAPVGRLVRGESRSQEWEPDWKLKLVMLREQREEAVSESKREAYNRPEIRAQRSALLKQAWEAGKFATRKQAYLKKTDALVRRAQRLRAQGWTYDKIGEAIGITAYTAMRWLGWTRPPKGESKRSHPVTVGGVEYPSERQASRETGIPRHRIRSRLSRSHK